MIPVLLTALSIFLSRGLSSDDFKEGDVVSIEHANNSFLPSYLGYFFVALSISSWSALFLFMVFCLFSLFCLKLSTSTRYFWFFVMSFIIYRLKVVPPSFLSANINIKHLNRLLFPRHLELMTTHLLKGINNE